MKLEIFSKLSKREKIITTVTVLIILALAADNFILKPTYCKIEELDNRISVYQQKLQNAYSVLSKENTITKEYEEKITHVKQYRNDEEEIAVFLSDIENLASNSTVTLPDIKPGTVIKKDYFSIYNAEIEVECEISFLVDFLYQIERLPQLLRIKTFSLASKEKNSKVLRGNIIITLILIEQF